MKILILSTFGNYGGAAVCSKRLKGALEKHGVEVKLGVLHAYDDSTSIFILNSNLFQKLRKWVFFILERLEILLSISRYKHLYKFSSGSMGTDILNNPHVIEADLIHLHWVHFGFLSIEQIAQLANKKPILWTLHDMWAFTGGCHYAMGCTLYKKECTNCFYLKNSKLSQRIQSQKIQQWSNASFRVVATSKWLADSASESTVFENQTVKVLSTPIDTSVFSPLDKKKLRSKYQLTLDQYFVLVGAVDLSDERKGFEYLKESLQYLSETISNLHLLTFGKMNQELVKGIESTSFGQISDLESLNEIYNLADVFVLSSVQDNLPNTVMEAMSCGVPVASFDCGGVGDMVKHLKTGYLSKNGDSKDLANGIRFVLEELNPQQASISSRSTILEQYSEEVIVKQHLQVYNELIS